MMDVDNITEGLLISIDQYLASGIHIGTQQKTKDMMRYIYRVRQDGLFVLDVKTCDTRLADAAKFLVKYNPTKILVVSNRQYGFRPIQMFSKLTGAKTAIGRFIPGMLTNPDCEYFFEPDVVLITDPRADYQALSEAVHIGVPVVALVDSENILKNIDIAVPANNKGKKSLSLIYYLLAREILRARGQLKPTDELPILLEDFESKAI